MGLCKCPKRQVTNQFCFEHRVNVCEHCMVASHPKCIVQSYLQWLKDSDYNSNCTLCGNTLDSEECVRLICFHVFHWSCINSRQSSLPSNTAPGGHKCPTCSDPMFPPANLVSPVADVLRSRLGQVNWGRNELGLPLLVEDSKDRRAKSVPSAKQESNEIPHQYGSTSQQLTSKKSNGSVFEKVPDDSQQSRLHSVLHMDTFNPHGSTRRTMQTNTNLLNINSDRDDKKYHRRTFREILNRFYLRLVAPAPRSIFGRPWIRNLLIFILFVVFIYLVATLGRQSAHNDPMLQHQDPNPPNHPDTM